ncbi:unnamed protein product [Mytilus edulis]|uniref:Apple domain-containing protein n=1 Tax=Mytilus edulis TaxID=6550 RepID=A0A8S3S2T7_MYTED|nr:unnamed protein product [Mytilus edulis]
MLILIAASDYWDFHIQLTDEAILELNFWKNNCTSLPRKSLLPVSFLPDRIVFTDASGFACAGFAVQTSNKIVHKMWTPDEAKKSSTFRELSAFRFKHSHWESLKHFSNPDLKALTVSLCSVVTASKSENTLKKYKGYFKRFKYWCLKYNLPFLPTTVCTVAIYLNYLIQSGVSTAVLNAAYYSIKWEHDLNLYDSILNDKLLDMVLEGGIRLLSKPLKRKEPITPTILKSIIAKFDKNDNLPGLRIFAMMLIGFSGFLRYDELAHIRSSDLTFNDSHLQLNIQKSKTDRYRQGNTILISRTGTDLCPVSMLQKYFRVANNSRLAVLRSSKIGRPSQTTSGLDRYIQVFHLRNQTIAATSTTVGIPELRRISSQTEKRSTANCLVRQIPNQDYTEPQFEISIHAGDDRSGVRLYLDVGTVPGGRDVLNKRELAGPATILSEKLAATGVPLYFTVTAENDSGQKSTASCYLSTYDITPPGGRFDEDYKSTSNPSVIKASVTVYEDSELVETKVAMGYGKGIWGDQLVPWNDVELDQSTINHVTAESDPLNRKVLEMFTSPRTGKLVGPKASKDSSHHSPGDCARACADLPPTKCMSFNFDSADGTCELVEAIEGYHFKRSRSGYFSHYERLGVGKTKQFNFDQIQLSHNKIFFVNFLVRNSLGYSSIINTQGVLVDLTTPITGEIINASRDTLKHVDCLSLIPEEHRPDWIIRCKGINPNIKNHRLIVDGPGSKAVFNANWDGFIDRESGLLGYAVFVGKSVCDDLIHKHHDPHKHLFEVSQWTHTATIYPIPAPYETLPDGKYYISVRALNNVKYGGPLATTICHSTPLTVDNSPPLILEIYDIRYNESTFTITAKHNSSDPHSGLAYNDVCLGRTKRDCIEMRWTRLSFDSYITLVKILTDGVPIWIKIRAINNVDLRTVVVADSSIIVDKTGPYTGAVMDGPLHGEDLLYTKYSDRICANWLHFYDPESGIGLYLVSVSSVKQINVTDIANLTEYSRTTHEACVELTPDKYLEHGHTYFTTVWAFNGAINQKNVSAISNGVTVDLTEPDSGHVIDGNKTDFKDIQFSGNAAKVEVQWRDYHDPESTIRQYDVQVQAAPNLTDNFNIIRDFVPFSNTTDSVKWLNFQFQHKDRVKIDLRTTNGAHNSVVTSTDGYVVDITPPKLLHLGDGFVQQKDLEFQSNAKGLSCNFKFIDEESGLDHFQIQIYRQHQSIRSQIVPATRNDWMQLDDETVNEFTNSSLDLLQGAVYSIRIGAVNKAGFVAAFETNGVKIDRTPPIINWLHVNTLSDDEEKVVDNYVWQADTTGIKAAWQASDHQSGIVSFKIAVGTTPGGSEVKSWTDIGLKTDTYIDGLSLDVSDIDTKTPVYYVSLVAINGAELESSPVVSTPIVVVESDRPGIVIDGTDRTDHDPVSDIGIDVDYQSDISTINVQYTGFESHLHGVMDYEWAVGTTPGGQDVTTFSSDGILHVEEETIAGDGVSSSGYAQVNAQLEPGKTYYSTIRGITNAGNIIESVSDGITVDILPPNIILDR